VKYPVEWLNLIERIQRENGFYGGREEGGRDKYVEFE